MAFKKEIEVIIEPKDIFVGDEDAPVTLMEFGDYESEACGKANEVVKQLLEEYEGKIKFNQHIVKKALRTCKCTGRPIPYDIWCFCCMSY